ncbi:hypothetical protein QWJ34_21550 [Saccharibacillus sp. CPCC 101409]|uniref:hypothetical protein n=1 Tax=Saccharibacillus sp. CPCC 101409 TaxID=3058041 RepID=UPI002672F8CA|nr:hypothetical protein [Saccharibacillus sp. CPCC 101409]MDO3412364.1 hypothetical protein [Saccharibacillus sp. CPCC 101409]
MKKSKSIVILAGLIFLFSGSQVYGAGLERSPSSPSASYTDFQSARVLQNRTVLLINPSRTEISCIEPKTERVLWTRSFNSIKDVDPLYWPAKVVVIDYEKGQLSRTTLNMQGKELTKRVYQQLGKQAEDVRVDRISGESNLHEKIALLENDVLKIFDAGQPKSQWAYSIKNTDELGSIVNFEVNGDYAVIKYEGSAIFSEQESYLLINLVKKTSKIISLPANIRSTFDLDAGVLNIATQFSDGIGGAGLKSDKPQTYFYQYSAANGNLKNEQASIFQAGDTFGWAAYFWREHIYVKDAGTQEWTVYTLNGTPLSASENKAKKTEWFLNYFSKIL